MLRVGLNRMLCAKHSGGRSTSGLRTSESLSAMLQPLQIVPPIPLLYLGQQVPSSCMIQHNPLTHKSDDGLKLMTMTCLRMCASLAIWTCTHLYHHLSLQAIADCSCLTNAALSTELDGLAPGSLSNTHSHRCSSPYIEQ